MTTDNTKQIAALNDEFRSYVGMPVFGPRVPGRIVITSGITALSPEAKIAIWSIVRHFDTFTPDNDPHGEHDFGAFDYQGQRIFWKIDYYDTTLTKGSEDPTDPKQTVRVLTIMLASEY